MIRPPFHLPLPGTPSAGDGTVGDNTFDPDGWTSPPDMISPDMISADSSLLDLDIPWLAPPMPGTAFQVLSTPAIPAPTNDASLINGGGSTTNGSGGVGNSGDLDVNGPTARSQFSVDGTGLRIGIISDSFDSQGLSALQQEEQSGDLPSTVHILSDAAGTDEGRAMAELIHELAPGAQIYFATAGGNEANTAAAVASLQAAGVNMIVDDVSWSTEPFFQDGDALQTAIETATAAGISYFTSAGNQSSHYYQTTYGALATRTVTINFSGTIQVDLQWTQPFASIGTGIGSAYSLGWELLDHGTNTVAYSSLNNQTNRDPVQNSTFSIAGGSYDLVIINNAGTAVATDTLKIAFIASDPSMVSMAGGTGSGTVFGHEMVTSANVVGAVNANTPSQIEGYSADGPGMIYYSSTGTKLTTPLTVGAPDYLAPDFIATSVSGFGIFAGTSAAAPEAAAVGALLLQINPNLTSIQIQTALASTASTAGLSGAASQEGAGLINADAAAELLYDGSAVVNGVTVYNGTVLSHDSVQAWNHASGNWSTMADWSAAGGPTITSYITLGDDLGTLTAGYTVMLNGVGGAIATLTVGNAASIATALNIATGGSLVVAGGATIGKSGAVTLSPAATLGIAGLLKLDDTTGTTAVLHVQAGAHLTTGNFDIIGGTASIAATGMLTTAGTAYIGEGGTASLAVAGIATVTGDVSVGQSGQISVAGGLTLGGTLRGMTGSSVEIDAGGTLSAVGMASGHLTLDYGGLLILSTSTTSVLTGNSGLKSVTIEHGGNTSTDKFAHILLTGIAYDIIPSDQSLVFFSGATTGTLILALNGVTALARLTFDNAGAFKQSSFSLSDVGGFVEINIACYVAGTRIATPDGETPVEHLRIGDEVLTAGGAARPIRWIGWRAYSAATVAAERRVRPVRIAAGALGASLPHRDLHVSPQHALLLRDPGTDTDVLVPASLLLNGASIAHASNAHAGAPEGIIYFHIELGSHDILLAEGQPAESFADRDSRAGFHNAAEFARLYPGAAPAYPPFCAPRVEGGAALVRLRAAIDARAGLRPLPLQGYIDRTDAAMIEGWAHEPANPEAPVLLEILLDGRFIGTALADQHRADLQAMNGGNCAFYYPIQDALAARPNAAVSVRRASDGQILPRVTQPARAA